MLARPPASRGAVFGALLGGQWLASMYFGMMVLVFLAPVAVFLAIAWSLRPTRALCGAVAVATVVAAAGWSVTALPFARSQQDRGERSRDEVRSGSAVPLDYLAISEGLVTYPGPLRRSENERELFPGAVTLGLVIAGAVPPHVSRHDCPALTSGCTNYASVLVLVDQRLITGGGAGADRR
jgi:hypothetical protein